MDRVVTAFKSLLNHRDALAAAAAAPVNDAIPWLQGVDNNEFRSPSKSLSGTAMERMRRRQSRSPSPATVHKPLKVQEPATMGDVDGQGKLGDREVISGSVPESKPAGKRSSSAVTQSVQKGMKKGGRSVAAAEVSQQLRTSTEHVVNTAAEASGRQSLRKSAIDAVAPTPASLSNRDNGGLEAAQQQLDAILAGLDSDEGSPPSNQGNPGNGPEAEDSTAKPSAPAARKKGKRTSSEAPQTTPKATKRSRLWGGAEAEAGGQSSRRIPTRLLPWNCPMCTFENKGGEHTCEMCQTAKPVGGGTATPAATAASHQEPETLSPTTCPGKKRGDAGALSKQKGQRKLTAGKIKVPKSHQETQAADTAAVQGRQNQQPSRLAKVGGPVSLFSPTVAAPEPAAAAPEAYADTGMVPWTGGKMSWVLLGSGLDSAAKARLRQLAAASGASVAEKWAPRITHVVCGGDDRTAKRTFKYLMGVLAGRCMVSESWVDACLAAGQGVHESEHEVEKDSMGCSRRPAKGRPGRGGHQAVGTDLLKGFKVQLQGEFGCRAQVVDLIKAAGGTLITRLPVTGAKDGAPGGVVLVDVPETSAAAADGFKAAIVEEAWFARASGAGVPVLSQRWLTDSISRLELCPMAPFAV